MPRKQTAEQKKRPRERAQPVYLIDPPAGATHFRLRKGGRNAPPCTIVNDNGVEVVHHALSRCTAEEIASRWGYDPHYWVAFSMVGDDGRRKNLGASKHVGLHDPRELGPEGLEVEGGTVLPAPSNADPVGSSLALFQSFKSISEKDVAASVQREQVRSDQHIALMSKMFEMMMHSANRTPAVSPELTAILAGQQALLAQLAQRPVAAEPPEDDEEEEEEELTEDEKVERFKKAWRKEGLGALRTLASEETIENMFKLLPKLRAKLPEAWLKIQPMLQAQLSGLLEPAPAPSPASSAPPAAAAPRPKAQTTTNGIPPAPRKLPRDELTPTVE